MAKIIERLEQKQCELAQPKEKAYLLNDGAGLYLTIQPNGKKLFNLVFGYGGKRISKALGELGKITLKDARELAKIKRAEIESVPKDTTAHNLKITFNVARSYNHANFERLKAKLYQYWADLLGDI